MKRDSVVSGICYKLILIMTFLRAYHHRFVYFFFRRSAFQAERTLKDQITIPKIQKFSDIVDDHLDLI